MVITQSAWKQTGRDAERDRLLPTELRLRKLFFGYRPVKSLFACHGTTQQTVLQLGGVFGKVYSHIIPRLSPKPGMAEFVQCEDTDVPELKMALQEPRILLENTTDIQDGRQRPANFVNE
jgi:hypothetical protein